MTIQDFSEFKKTFGGKVRHYRKVKKITQENLAESVGVSVITISRIEHGKTMPSISRLFLIAGALEVSAMDFFETDILELSTSLKDIKGHSKAITDIAEDILKKTK